MTTSLLSAGERTRFRLPLRGGAGARALVTLLLALLATTAAPSAAKTPRPRTIEEDFGKDVELAPFIVRGEQLTISIHARSGRDRKYAETFSEEVVKVVYEGVTEQTGKGLVIIGAKGEPHPIVVFRKFEAMAAAGALDPAVAQRSGELNAFFEKLKQATARGEDAVREDGASDGTGPLDAAGKVSADGMHATDGDDQHVEMDLEFERIIQALPLPLEGVGAKLYQIAWAERFDEARVDARLRALRAEDLERDVFARFDWVFYLPPRGAFDRVLNEFINEAMKEDDMGFFSRMAMRTVLAVVKPMIRRAVEGMRKTVLFFTVVRARTGYTDDQIGALCTAYVEVLMPGAEKKTRGSEHERAVWAVREAREHLDEAGLARELEEVQAIERVEPEDTAGFPATDVAGRANG